MGVTVLAAAAVTGLIELATVKSRLSITGSDQDADLTGLIAAAGSAFAARLGDPLFRQQYRESMPGRGRRRLQLSRWPVDPDSITVEVDEEAVTDFAVEDAAHGWLYRRGGWPAGCVSPGEDPEHRTVVTYHAGFLPPSSTIGRGSVTTWEASTAYPLGAWARPSGPALSPLRFECVTAGTSGAMEPTWPEAGESVTDGSAAWTARRVEEIPPVLQDLAWSFVFTRYKALNTAPGVAAWELAGQSESYFASQTGEYMPLLVANGLDIWRANR